MFVADLHNDLVQRMMIGENISKLTKVGHTDIPRLENSSIDMIYSDEDKINEADELLNSILINENLNEEICIVKANILSKKKLHYKAIEYLNKILTMGENNNEIHYLIGIEYLFLKNFIKAKSNFINSLNYNSSDHGTLYNIIYCFEMLNKKLNSIRTRNRTKCFI